MIKTRTIQPAAALGTLPLPLKGAIPCEDSVPGAPIVDYGAVLRGVGLEKEAVADIVGRSLVIPYPGSECLLVLKMAREGDTPGNLQRESDWMSYLRARKHAFTHRFDIPEPIKIAGATVFRLIDLPATTCLPSEALHPAGYAIGFKTTHAYYEYPNESCPAMRLGEERFQEVMCRNTRKLFDKEVLKKAVHGIFKNYYKGFTGASYCNGVPFDMDALVDG